MAAIDDLISQIEDKALRERLRIETNRITKEKKFGLVFEDHLPELTPIYSAKVRKHSKVAQRNGALMELWHVLSVSDGKAHCRNIGSEETQQIPVDDLVVVCQFGEPIFPALIPVDKVQNGLDDAPWHTLIEADNYHALQLLEYLYAGKVDCIYIDPPYNTGARDWKYNNDYVDVNDRWRHSKWLAMMKRRLIRAFRLLKSNGVMVITVDDHELHHLRSLIETYHPSCPILGVVAIRNNPSGRSTVSGFSVCHEYALFIGKTVDSKLARFFRSDEQWARFKERDVDGPFEWRNFRKDGGATTYRKERRKQFYPIYVSERHGIRVPDMTWDDSVRDWDVKEKPKFYETELYPLGSSGAERVWSFSPESTIDSLSQLQLRWSSNGTPMIYRKYRPSQEGVLPRSWWDKKEYSAREYGTASLNYTFGESNKFPFSKSPYAVADCLWIAGAIKHDALVIDFFAGSGTTLHALNILNGRDQGRRRCILVTNNEVSADRSEILRSEGQRPGNDIWECEGICRSITWPRSKYTILGKREDGSELDGEYFTGKTIQKEKPRKFQQIGFTSIDELNTVSKKKQLVALVKGIPQSEVRKDSAFIVSEKNPASILFDDSQADAWLETLEDQEHITDFYIVTAKKSIFDELKSRIHTLLGLVIITEEEKYPMRQGFPANLEYFRLDFLDKDHVALGRQFREILPILWLRAGAIGARPELPKNKPIPAMVIPRHNPFAVLVDETCFADFAAELESRDDMTHAFLVTDSEEAFQEMAGQLRVPNLIQLYRDYLENFVINKERGSS